MNAQGTPRNGATGWDRAWLDTARPARRTPWRGVEAQHRVATMRLVDSLEEQEILERLLEASKPPPPEAARGSHYLVFTPFRYTSPHASRFRRANAPGVWYGADDPSTVCAELAWWRWRFLRDSEGLRESCVITEHTLFQAVFAGRELDLTRPPWNALRAHWRDPSDYTACHGLADAVRAAREPIDSIRYESARRGGGLCAAVLRPQALSVAARHAQQTWICKTGPRGALFTSTTGAGSLGFEFAQEPAR